MTKVAGAELRDQGKQRRVGHRDRRLVDSQSVCPGGKETGRPLFWVTVVVSDLSHSLIIVMPEVQRVRRSQRVGLREQVIRIWWEVSSR